MTSRFSSLFKTNPKTALVACVAAAVAATGVFSAGTVVAQQGAAKAPSKVGLIDMAEVFKEFKKFTALREDLKNEMVQMDTAAKPQIQEMQRLQKQLQSGAFASGSPEKSQAEEQLINVSTKLEALRKKSQVDVMRKESEIYKDVYLEIQAAVEKFSKYQGYDMVIRFNSSKLEEQENPQAVLQQMNRNVIYHNPADNITGVIVKYLNKQYETASK